MKTIADNTIKDHDIEKSLRKRRSLGLNQDKIAEIIGVSRYTVITIEKKHTKGVATRKYIDAIDKLWKEAGRDTKSAESTEPTPTYIINITIKVIRQ